MALLVSGKESPSQVAAWASEFLKYEDPQLYPPVEDPVVWKALDQLAGADLQTSPDELLHNRDDFEAWLKELREAPPPASK